MSIYDAIANAGSNAGAGLNAFARNRYMIQQDQAERERMADNEARNRFVQDRQFAAQQNQVAQQAKERHFQQAVQMAAGGADDGQIVSWLSQMDKNVDPQVIPMIRSLARASGGPPQKPVIIRGQDGRPIYSNPQDAIGKEAASLTSGRPVSVMGENGRPIWVSPQDAVGRPVGATSIDPIRERKIADYEKMGLPWDVATRLADGQLRIEQTDSGQVRIMDNITGEVREVQIAGGPQPDDLPPPSQTLWEAASLGTGPLSAVRNAASVVSGAVGGPVAEETIRARQRLQLATRGLVRSLVNNPRFPVAEVQMVLNEAGTVPKTADNPAAMQQRLIELNDFLGETMRSAELDAQNPNLPQDLRRDQAANAANIRAFIRQIGIPDQPPAGVSRELWEAMTEEEKALWR